MKITTSLRAALTVSGAIAAIAMLPSSSFAAADYTVQVGYADGVRGAGFFPNPWDGDAGVQFVGTNQPSPDAGAIRIINNTASALTINDVSVNIGGNIFDLWGSNTLGVGNSLVLTATANYNFDTSDYNNTGCGINDGVTPQVTITESGTPTTFSDTGQVLNTNGYDFVCKGNESFQWRDIGTNGTPSGTPSTPEPAAFASFGIGMIGLLLLSFREFRRRSVTA